MAELPLNRREVTGFLDELPAHGMAGVMGRVALNAGQAAYLFEHRIETLWGLDDRRRGLWLLAKETAPAIFIF